MNARRLQSAPGRKGSALLIILAFVLLLTIITTAFLSKALLEKNVSNASADQTRTDVFAAGAVDAILSDCQQEIAAGSIIKTQNIGSTQVSICTPTSALTFVPSRTWQSTQITQPNPLPNLLKRSACALTFFPTGAMYGSGNYNSTVYPPSETTFTAADPNDSTGTPSLNGRVYSSARWNKALLLPKANLATTNYSDYTANAAFTVPDWILVQRDGTNPTAWSNALCVPAPDDVTTTNKNPVVGRYAYAIYDEGGLLDMNVAGYPSTAYTTSAGTFQHFYRSTLATVDLTTLAPMTVSGTTVSPGTPFFPITGPNKNSGGNTWIDEIVGWRNYATLPVTGSIPSYTLPSVSTATNYFVNVQPPGNGGFMHTTVPSSVTSISGLSDRKFSSRQQLIDLLLNDIAQGNTTTQATLQNALQYMGTFSRDLNQPSYVPDTNRPQQAVSATTVTTTAGTTVTDVAYTGSNASASDDHSGYINVGFPTTLVQTSFTRNDGTTANVGDPVVNKRFALNRLAWLTYAGPIATDSGTYNTAAGISTLVATLKAQYGYTDAFLEQGGPTNIANYFGLQWQQDPNDDPTNSPLRYKWFYNVHNNSAGSTGKGIIRELGGSIGIAASGDSSPHDPDFFELLKAAILAGSKGKALTDLTGAKYFQGGAVDFNHPYNAQNNIDVSLDYQILQIGSNIIDQSRLDPYTTEIIFDNGTGPFEVRGVENYPYLYRLRTGILKLRNENVVVPDAVDKTAAPTSLSNPSYAPSTKFSDTGVAALMQIPEIWNPHDVNSPMGGFTNAAYPTTFRIVVDSTTPAQLATQGSLTPTYATINTFGEDNISNAPLNNVWSNSANTPYLTSPTSVTFPYTYGPAGTGTSFPTGYAGESIKLTPANTALQFSIPLTGLVPTYNGMFREPTMLARPLLPNGSGLKLAWTSTPTDWSSVMNTAGTICYSAGNGFLSDIANPLNLATAPPQASTYYLGIVLGLFPVQWVVPGASPPALTSDYIYYSNFAVFNPSLANYGLTYRMQYQDPIQGGWVTYDEKYITPNSTWVMMPVAGKDTGALVFQNNFNMGGGNHWYQSSAWQTFADPRTSRFGAPGGDNDIWSYLAAPAVLPFNASPDWLDSVNGVLVTDRPDYNQGFMFECFRTSGGTSLSASFAPGWPTANPTDSTTPTYYDYRWGPLTQNTISVTGQGVLRYSGDTASTTGLQPFYYADADGVVRRAMGGLVPSNSSSITTTPYGYPMAPSITTGTATASGVTTGYKYASATYQGGAGVSTYQSSSRPYLLKRPFRSVGELGYVFSGTPWKNLDMTNPESGDSPLLDVFCINDTDDPNALVAGRVNLNTQQVPVLAAILSEAYYDDLHPNTSSASYGGYIGAPDPIKGAGTATATAAFYLANWLVTGPESSLGTVGSTGTSVTPLMNPRELVGKWQTTGSTTAPVDGTSTSNYAGFSSDITSFYNPSTGPAASYFNGWQPRFREAAMRALSAVGETRVWNLMIDVVAQTGRYPSTATNASNFVVEGERRYWVHVAIDRYTGKILDRQIEEVRQ